MSFEINLLHTFMTVVGCRNLTHAAEIIGIEQPAVSKQIKKLQEQLGVDLIVPHQSGLVLTPEGEHLARIAPSMLEGVDRLPIDLKAIKNKPEGELKVIVENFGRDLVNEYILEFSRLFPNITLNVRTEEYKSLLFSGQLSGAFVGITALPKPQKSSYIWKRVGASQFFPFAHPTYLEEFGHPQAWDDLDGHRLVRYEWNKGYSYYNDDLRNNSLLYQGREGGKPRKHFITTDDVFHCKALLVKGVGIGAIPAYQSISTDLVRLLDGVFDPKKNINGTTHLVYPTYGVRNYALKTFVDFVLDKVKKDENWLQLP